MGLTLQHADLREAGDRVRQVDDAGGDDVQREQREGLRRVALGRARRLQLAHVVAAAQVLNGRRQALQPASFPIRRFARCFALKRREGEYPSLSRIP